MSRFQSPKINKNDVDVFFFTGHLEKWASKCRARPITDGRSISDATGQVAPSVESCPFWFIYARRMVVGHASHRTQSKLFSFQRLLHGKVFKNRKIGHFSAERSMSY